MSAFILIFLIFFLPLVVVPLGPAFFEPPKVIFAEISIEIMVILFLIKNWKTTLISVNRKFIYALGGIFILTVIDLFFLQTSISFFGNTFRLQGIFLIWHLLILAFIASRIKLPKIPHSLYFISGTGLAISFFLLGENKAGRLVGTMGEPNALATAIIFLWPFLFFKYPNIVFRSVLVIILAGLIVMTESASGIIAFSVQMILWGLIYALKIPVKKAMLFSLIIIVASFILPFIEGGGWYENRAEVWAAAATVGLQNPIFGGGFGNLEKLIPEGSRILQNNARFQYVDSAHNIFLDFWVQGGVVGLGTFLWLLFLSIKNLTSQSRQLELILLVGLLTMMSFNPMSVVALIQLWFLIGYSFQNHPLHKASEPW